MLLIIVPFEYIKDKELLLAVLCMNEQFKITNGVLEEVSMADITDSL